MTYSTTTIHLQQQPRGRNLNAPIDGVRPDPNFANVIESITDTEIRRHEAFANAIISLAAPSPALQQARFNWRRLTMNAGYTLIFARNNSAGPFAVSPSGNIEDDWGPGPADSPYRIQILLTARKPERHRQPHLRRTAASRTTGQPVRRKPRRSAQRPPVRRRASLAPRRRHRN